MHQTSGLNLTLAGDGQSTGRAYDAGTGRWLSRDPLTGAEISQMPNLYGYVGENPIVHTDRFGLQSESSSPRPKPWSPWGPDSPYIYPQVVIVSPLTDPHRVHLQVGPTMKENGPTCIERAQQIFYNNCQLCAELYNGGVYIDLKEYWDCQTRAGKQYWENVRACCYFIQHPERREVLQH